MFNIENKGNLVVHQISEDLLSIKEVKIPYFHHFEGGESVSVTNIEGVIKIDASIDTRLIVDDKIKGTNIHYSDGRVGIGRGPLYTYKFDIAVPHNTLMTAFHVGDGVYGFSMGNGTNQGFVPEIIGMGSDENDAGLYFIGRAGNNLPSSIPLIIMDGRNNHHEKINNRPLFGITNSDYQNYKFIIDYDGHTKIHGNVIASDFILDSSVSFKDLLEIIIEQKTQIDILKDKLSKLEK